MKQIFIISFFVMIGLGGYAQTRSSVLPGMASKMVRFYPNPASAFVNFDIAAVKENVYSLSVFNFMGKKVFESKNTPNHTTLRLDDFFRGIYIYQVRDLSGRVIESGKFQVVK